MIAQKNLSKIKKPIKIRPTKITRTSSTTSDGILHYTTCSAFRSVWEWERDSADRNSAKTTAKVMTNRILNKSPCQWGVTPSELLNHYSCITPDLNRICALSSGINFWLYSGRSLRRTEWITCVCVCFIQIWWRLLTLSVFSGRSVDKWGASPRHLLLR